MSETEIDFKPVLGVGWLDGDAGTDDEDSYLRTAERCFVDVSHDDVDSVHLTVQFGGDDYPSTEVELRAFGAIETGLKLLLIGTESLKDAQGELAELVRNVTARINELHETKED